MALPIPSFFLPREIHMTRFSSFQEADGSPGSETQVTSRSSLQAFEPSLSPDGLTTVFESHMVDVEGNGVIFKYKIDGSSQYIPLTASNEDARQPNWSPAGFVILFQKHEGVELINIWTMDSDGSNQTRVTSGPGEKTDACFTPDGQSIVFSSDFELDFSNLYRIPITGGPPLRISFFRGVRWSTFNFTRQTKAGL